jgi:hypothetical protein
VFGDGILRWLSFEHAFIPGDACLSVVVYFLEEYKNNNGSGAFED